MAYWRVARELGDHNGSGLVNTGHSINWANSSWRSRRVLVQVTKGERGVNILVWRVVLLLSGRANRLHGRTEVLDKGALAG